MVRIRQAPKNGDFDEGEPRKKLTDAFVELTNYIVFRF